MQNKIKITAVEENINNTMNILKCKIIKADENYETGFVILDQNYNVIDCSEPRHNDGSAEDCRMYIHSLGYDTRLINKINKIYGVKNWELDFSDMYSDENDKIKVRKYQL